jgi:serine/threonine protein kinase
VPDYDYAAGRFEKFLAQRGVPVRRTLAFAGLSTLALVDLAGAGGEPEQAVAKGLSGYYHVIADEEEERRAGVYGYYWYKRFGPKQHAQWRAAFELEYRTLLACRGEAGIVQVLSGDLDGEIPYYLMRYHGRGSLSQEMASAGGKLPVDFALSVVHDVTSGLDALHRNGVAHRDLNSENVLIGESGRAVVADLGCARLLSSGPSGPARRPDEFHWPPEYASDYATAGVEADLYALGVLVFQLVTGRMPRHGGPSCAEAAATGSFPAAIPELADACLEYDPANRPASASEVLARLAGHLPH